MAMQIPILVRSRSEAPVPADQFARLRADPMSDACLVTGNFGRAIGLIGIARVALSLVLIVWFWMPETIPSNTKPHARLSGDGSYTSLGIRLPSN
jgi:hypothetical protein